MHRQKSDVVDAAEFVAAKLRWQLALLCDTSLSTGARLLGALMMHDFDDRFGGFAWRSQGARDPKELDERKETYRGRTGFNVRTIQIAAQELEAAGFIQIEQGRGRGHSNRYWPRLEKAVSAPPFASEKPVSAPPFDPEKAGFSTLKGGPCPALLLQDSNKEQRTAFADQASAVAAVIDAAGLSEGEAAMLRACRFDPVRGLLVLNTQTAFIALRERAGPEIESLGLRLACAFVAGGSR